MPVANMTSPLRVAILTGLDCTSTREEIGVLTTVDNIKLVGIVFDSEEIPFSRRLKNLRRNLRREGWTYLGYRAGAWARQLMDMLVARIVPSRTVETLLRQAMPQRSSSLEELAGRFGIPIMRVGNLNGPRAIEAMKGLNADLGVVLGTRILKRTTFSIPRMGCLNLHKGRVPDYRGMPPGFWELYDRQTSAGVTIHFVDDGLDTGDVVGEASVPIHHRDTVETLQQKLDLAARVLLRDTVGKLAGGAAERRPQPPCRQKPRTSPTRAQRAELAGRAGYAGWNQGTFRHLAKSTAHLLGFYSGLFHITRAVRIVFKRPRVCILLYHRVNDLVDDELTTGIRRFAEHIVVLNKYYQFLSSSELVRRLREGRRIERPTIVVHFDDCYQDVAANAAPILKAAGVPAACFVSTGFVDTGRTFAHDESKSPFAWPNVTRQDLRSLLESGCEIGSHGVNHANLASCGVEKAWEELVVSKRFLEDALKIDVGLFAYPFGRERHMTRDVAALVPQAGYAAMFSAYGGHVTKQTSLYDIPRIGMCGRYRPLDLLMEVEGLSFRALRKYRS